MVIYLIKFCSAYLKLDWFLRGVIFGIGVTSGGRSQIEFTPGTGIRPSVRFRIFAIVDIIYARTIGILSPMSSYCHSNMVEEFF